MVENKIHFSLQIVPKSKNHDTYELVDEAIKIIQDSGIRHMITPMETVFEGTYEEVISISEKAQKACLNAGAEEVLVFIKMHYRKDGDVTFEEKRLDR